MTCWHWQFPRRRVGGISNARQHLKNKLSFDISQGRRDLCTTYGHTDFKASTIAISTSCKLISNKCDLRADSGVVTPFEYLPSFRGDLTGIMSNCELGNLQIPSTSISFFRDPDLTQNFTGPGWSHANPVYIDVSAIVRGYAVDPSPLFNDPEIVLPIQGQLQALLRHPSGITWQAIGPSHIVGLWHAL